MSIGDQLNSSDGLSPVFGWNCLCACLVSVVLVVVRSDAFGWVGDGTEGWRTRTGGGGQLWRTRTAEEFCNPTL